MNRKAKWLIFLFLFFATFFAIAIHYDNNLKLKAKIDQKKRIAAVGNIQFKGKVISVNKIEAYGKDYCIICIKLDYTNTNSFYILNSINFIKIRHGIASMSGGIYIENYLPNYIEVNINNSGIERFYYSNQKPDEMEISLSAGGVTKEEANTCN